MRNHFRWYLIRFLVLCIVLFMINYLEINLNFYPIVKSALSRVIQNNYNIKSSTLEPLFVTYSNKTYFEAFQDRSFENNQISVYNMKRIPRSHQYMSQDNQLSYIVWQKEIIEIKFRQLILKQQASYLQGCGIDISNKKTTSWLVRNRNRKKPKNESNQLSIYDEILSDIDDSIYILGNNLMNTSKPNSCIVQNLVGYLYDQLFILTDIPRLEILNETTNMLIINKLWTWGLEAYLNIWTSNDDEYVFTYEAFDEIVNPYNDNNNKYSKRNRRLQSLSFKGINLHLQLSFLRSIFLNIDKLWLNPINMPILQGLYNHELHYPSMTLYLSSKEIVSPVFLKRYGQIVRKFEDDVGIQFKSYFLFVDGIKVNTEELKEYFECYFTISDIIMLNSNIKNQLHDIIISSEYSLFLFTNEVLIKDNLNTFTASQMISSRIGYQRGVSSDAITIWFNDLENYPINHITFKGHLYIDKINEASNILYEIIKRETLKSKEKRVVSFGLYGNVTKYTKGAIENAKLCQSIFFDWICRFYCDGTVPRVLISQLLELKAEVISIEMITASWNNIPIKIAKNSFRFLIADDDSVDRFIIRDTDSRLSYRDYIAVNDWIESEEMFHNIRDHPYHCQNKIMGAMWGAKRPILKDMRDLLYNWTLKGGNEALVPFADQVFLADVVWPLVKDYQISHDSYCCVSNELFYSQFDRSKRTKPFLTMRSDREFIGQVVYEDEISEPYYSYLISVNPSPLSCRRYPQWTFG